MGQSLNVRVAVSHVSELLVLIYHQTDVINKG